MSRFKQKKRSFCLCSGGKARQSAACANNPMTRNKDQQRILSACSAHSACCPGPPDHPGKLAVCPCFAIRHAEQRMINRLFKCSTTNAKRQIKRASGTGEILLQLSAGLQQKRRRAVFKTVVFTDTDCADKLILFLTKAHQPDRR